MPFREFIAIQHSRKAGSARVCCHTKRKPVSDDERLFGARGCVDCGQVWQPDEHVQSPC